MKTYIINLKRSEKRRKHVIGQALKHGLDYELVDAVDGARLSKTEIEAVSDPDAVRRFPGWLTDRAIAAALSHRKVFDRIIENGDEIALVMEDDVLLLEDFYKTALTASRFIRTSEVILLHYFGLGPTSISNKDEVDLGNERKLVFPISVENTVSAAAYLISTETARRLRDFVKPIRITSDCWSGFVAGGAVNSIRFVYPKIVSVIGAKSTISVENQSKMRAAATEFIEDNEVPFLNRLLRNARIKRIEANSDISVVDERSPLAVASETKTRTVGSK